MLPADYVARHVELGWAVTGYGNQGDTVDVGIAVLEPGTTRNHAYVALTRGREANHAFIPDPTGTLEPADHLAQVIDPDARPRVRPRHPRTPPPPGRLEPPGSTTSSASTAPSAGSADRVESSSGEVVPAVVPTVVLGRTGTRVGASPRNGRDIPGRSRA